MDPYTFEMYEDDDIDLGRYLDDDDDFEYDDDRDYELYKDKNWDRIL